MIQITNKNKCCGCSACVQVCPKQCITFNEDNHGFRYPKVNKEDCINCGLCEKVCPFCNSFKKSDVLAAQATINPSEDIRLKSSSGGIFSMLAEYVINQGGVVFGARFNEKWEVIHDYTENLEGIDAFRGSKYVQSIIEDSYNDTKHYLNQGRLVLFSGTPCQISGLTKFLRKDYENLITVEVACHGVPSPLIWREYIKQIAGRKRIQSISFRDKSTGYRTYSTNYTIAGKSYKKYYKRDDFMVGFINNLYLRPSCFNCPSKGDYSCADLTIADYWGATERQYEEGGSLVLSRSQKGKDILHQIKASLSSVDYVYAIKMNPCLAFSTKETNLYSKFWNSYDEQGIAVLSEYTRKLKPTFIDMIKMYIHKKLNI